MYIQGGWSIFRLEEGGMLYFQVRVGGGLCLFLGNVKYMKNILGYIDAPIVSVDIIGNKYSCVFDSQLTSVIGKMVKVVGWYDNEMGYSNRLIDLVEKIS